MRGRRVPLPPVRPADPDDPAELLEIKFEEEEETWREQLPAAPPRSQTKRTMLQLAERPGQPMIVIPSSGYVRAAWTDAGDRSIVKAAAAVSSADGGGSDSDGDASMVDPDQFLELELASGKSEAAVDEELTSLSWLQSTDLLKGIRLRAALEAVPPPVEQREHTPEEDQSRTSDYLEEGADEWPSIPGSPRGPKRFYAPRYPDHKGYAYDPKLHSHFKPPFSYSCLIFMAIEDSFGKALPVREIYAWIQNNFPFYMTAPPGWKNSVRHNLSLNKCFKRVDMCPVKPSLKAGRTKGSFVLLTPNTHQGKPWLKTGMAKGSFWMVEPHYRTSLIQTLHRSRAVYPGKYDQVKAEVAAANATGQSRRLRVARTKGTPINSRRRRGKGADAESGPNPSLFPFLAARLMSSSNRSRPEGTADPLAGPQDEPSYRLLTPQAAHLDKSYSQMREGQFPGIASKRKRNADPDILPCFQRVIMISRSASEDHTYAFSLAADEHKSCGPDGAESGEFDVIDVTDSEDEAFSDDSHLAQDLRVRRCVVRTSWSSRPGDLTPEEVEGADLLLNLAGVSRSGSRAQSPQPAAAPRHRSLLRSQSPQPAPAPAVPAPRLRSLLRPWSPQPDPAPAPGRAPRRRPGRPRRTGR